MRVHFESCSHSWRAPNFGGQRALSLGSGRCLENTTPDQGPLPVFFINENCWKRTTCEVTKFNKKNCLDKRVHYRYLSCETQKINFYSDGFLGFSLNFLQNRKLDAKSITFNCFLFNRYASFRSTV